VIPHGTGARGFLVEPERLAVRIEQQQADGHVFEHREHVIEQGGGGHRFEILLLLLIVLFIFLVLSVSPALTKEKE
jgi:hypothetical protein